MDQGLMARPPASFWRPVPCGHPDEPLAWRNPDLDIWVCHCAQILDPKLAIPFDEVLGFPLVHCNTCGCMVGLKPEGVATT